MASRQQIEANQRNAARSTGPNTRAGKERASRNAVKSRLHARKYFVPPEDEPFFAMLRDDICQRHQPVGAMEVQLVAELVRAYWKLDLLNRAEDAVHARLAARMAAERTYDSEVTATVVGAKLHMFEEITEQMLVEAGMVVQHTREDFDGALRLAVSDPGKMKGTVLIDRLRQSTYRSIKHCDANLAAVQEQRREREKKAEKGQNEFEGQIGRSSLDDESALSPALLPASEYL